LFEGSLHLTLEKFQWIERNLPKYIPDRLLAALNAELEYSEHVSDLTKGAIITDIIYAIIKNANWHTSSEFNRALCNQINARFQVEPAQTILLARELLGNSLADEQHDAEQRFLVVYLLAWHEQNEFSERLSGLSGHYRHSLLDRPHESNPRAYQILHWLNELKKDKSLWIADEIRVLFDLDPSKVHHPSQENLFEKIMQILTRRAGYPILAASLSRIGILYCLDPEELEYALTREGEWMMARYACRTENKVEVDQFLDWNETWQNAYFNSQHPEISSLMEALIEQKSLPKTGSIAGYITALQRMYKPDEVRHHFLLALECDGGGWKRAALLASGKHLLSPDEIPDYATSLLNSGSDSLQRITADILFS